MLSVEELHRLLAYDPITGVFRWKERGDNAFDSQFAGEIAGWLDSDGYRIFQIKGHYLRAARVAWALVKGVWPDREIDHENLDKSDDRWENLRPASRGENAANQTFRKTNQLKAKGVHWDRSRQKYYAQICIDGRKVNLGRYLDLEEAKRAYFVASAFAFGAYANT